MKAALDDVKVREVKGQVAVIDQQIMVVLLLVGG